MSSGQQTEKPFNPHSRDAMFATILARMDRQDEVLSEISEGVKKTNGRVTSLEHWRTGLKAKVALAGSAAGAAAAALGWCADKLLG
jgi:hypothetical protein